MSGPVANVEHDFSKNKRRRVQPRGGCSLQLNVAGQKRTNNSALTTAVRGRRSGESFDRGHTYTFRVNRFLLSFTILSRFMSEAASSATKRDFNTMSSSDQIESYPRPGKTAIVTGGSSGLGRTSAIALARAGWNVTVTGRRENELQESVNLINQAAGREGAGHFVSGDITKEDVVLRTFKETAEKFGRVDLVFCNAGISVPAVPLAEQKLSDWQATVDVNLTASWLCAREAFRYMEKQQPQGGRIIINGSISAYAPRPNAQAYTATKTAMTGLTKTLSLDGRKFNIAVTQIDVGNAASEMTAKMKSGPGVPQSDGSLRHEPTMDRDWVGKEIVHVAEMPLGVNGKSQSETRLSRLQSSLSNMPSTPSNLRSNSCERRYPSNEHAKSRRPWLIAPHLSVTTGLRSLTMQLLKHGDKVHKMLNGL